ncbi:MAG: NUDIX domain-containing protein [Gammaproteobacteria bacterium]
MEVPQDYEHRVVVTAFLRRRGQLLLVRRSQRVGTYQGLWSAVSGYVEHPPYEQALNEINEETRLNSEQVRLIAAGDPLEILDASLRIRWTIHPFLFEVSESADIQLDWENTEFRWVTVTELDSYPTVPALKEALDRCLDTPPNGR